MNRSLTKYQSIVLGIILLEIPLRLDVHLDYHATEAGYGALGGWSFSITTLCLGALYAWWLAELALHKVRPERWWKRGALPGLIYVLVMALSVVVAQQPLLSMFELFSMLQAFLIFFYLFRWIRNSSDVRFVVNLLMVGLLLQSICMLGLRVLGHSVQFAGVWARVDEGGRVGGTIGAPNEAASYLTLLLPLALGVIVAGWSGRSRLLAIACLAVGLPALITTHSRGGWIATLLALGIVFAAAFIRRRISILAPIAVSLAAVIVAVVFSDVILARLTKDDKGSAYSRITLTQVAMRVVEDDPILGCGANNMAVAMKPYAQSSDFRGTWGYVTHNRHLQVWAETGLVGLVAWLAFLLTSMLRGWRAWRADDRFLSPLALGAMAGIVGVVLHMSVEVFGGRAQMQILWVLAALAAVSYRLTALRLGDARGSQGALQPMREVRHDSGALAGAVNA